MRDPNTLTLDELEQIEKQSLRVLFQAAVDFGFDAFDIFNQSTDDVKDVAEDITREMMDRIGGYTLGQRVLGNVDYRKARYVILPEMLIRQALFVDSKAEKASRTATLQLSQVSMEIHQERSGVSVHEKGKLPPVSVYGENAYLTTTLLAHYHYEEKAGHNLLKTLNLASLPNGRLQERYNPNAQNTIWLAGRNAPTLAEEFRVRLGFHLLEGKAAWRVQRLTYQPAQRQIDFVWRD